MYQRWGSKRSRERTMQLLEEQLFCDMYETLRSITKEYDEPSPAELWDEASRQWKPLLAAKRPKMYVEMLKDELTEEYGERSAFLILMILMYMMVAMFRPLGESPYRPFCLALADATQDYPLLRRLWEGVRQTEDEEEKAGKRIGVVVSLLTDIRASGQSIELDTIEQCILRLPTYDAQQKALEQADNLLRGTAWSQRSAAVQDKMIARAREQQDILKKIADKPSVQVDIKKGAHAQISEQGITNQFPQLPSK